jgi:tetratricopeptide (TPR) repeat protein/serine/threonine protein kinase
MSVSAKSNRECDTGSDPALADLVEELTNRLRAGEAVDVEACAAAHPEHAEQLRQILPALRVLEDLSGSGGPGPDAVPPARIGEPGASAPGDALAGTLGDFRLIREVGRGGMGVVYEAEQISLSRRVALKVLPFAAVLDPRQLQRFHNEARAAACLHHEHIVPVYAVGSERGVYFYAMQFIDGHTVAAVIALHQQPGATDETVDVSRPLPGDGEGPGGAPAEAPFAPAAEAGAGAASTEDAPRDAASFRRVAGWGVQAAEALEHAHSLGVVHRDVKPANLMIDGHGRLWVTDFGLARTAADSGLTLTGDLVGTLRYMSPEQALAKHGLVDHRTDVYSLGATLYELLTLRPACGGSDRQELLRQIAFEEPRRPRKLNKVIPGDLETIVLKAMEKNPGDRYATAQELADDLERWLRDEPIRARRPTVLQRLRRWSRRHRPVVAGLAAGLLTLLVLGVVLAFSYQRRLTETERGVTAALVQAETLLAEGDDQTDRPERWQATARLAQGAVEKAEELLAAGRGTPELTARVRQVRAAVEAAVTDSRLLVELDRIRLEQAAEKNGRFNTTRAVPLYAELFGKYGIELAAPEAAAVRVRGSRLREALLAALEDWARLTRDAAERCQLVKVLQAVESAPDTFRARWLKAVRRPDTAALVKLAGEPQALRLPATAVANLANDLRQAKELAAAERLLRAGQERFPDNFWLNHNLGILLREQGPARAEEAIGYLRAALALRRDSPGAYFNLAFALKEKGDTKGAVRCYRAALAIDPNFALAHNNLAIALHDAKDLEGAIRCLRTAIRLDPKLATAYDNLGKALREKGDLGGAIRCFRTALEVDPKYAPSYLSLGLVRLDKKDSEGAIRCYKSALAIDAQYADAHYGLGLALKLKGDLGGAIRCYQTALRINPTFADAHNNLGNALMARGDPEGAIREYRAAVQSDSKNAEAHNNLGNALSVKGDLEEAIRCHKAALAIDPNYAIAHYNLGLDLMLRKGDLEGAVDCFQAALAINPRNAKAHGALGQALLEQGKFADASQATTKALELLPPGHPLRDAAVQQLRQCKRLAAVDAKSSAILRGQGKPSGAVETVMLAWLCQRPNKQLTARAAGFYAEAFTDPTLGRDLEADHRYAAARAAALAGCGQGKDAAGLSEPERARLRRQALDWLRADLAAWRQQLETEPSKARPVVREQMQHWRRDDALSVVRGPEALARLLEAERLEWQKLWEGVAALQKLATSPD